MKSLSELNSVKKNLAGKSLNNAKRKINDLLAEKKVSIKIKLMMLRKII
jgi:hypothetical protein